MRVKLLETQGKSLVGSIIILPIENLREKSFENVIFIFIFVFFYIYFLFQINFKLIIKKISFLLMRKFLLICKKIQELRLDANYYLLSALIKK